MEGQTTGIRLLKALRPLQTFRRALRVWGGAGWGGNGCGWREVRDLGKAVGPR